MSDIITKLKNAHPYIYMINGSYYCIGSSVFYECSNEEKEAFDNLMNTFNDLVHLEYDIEDRDTIKLCQQYLSIFGRRKDHAYDSDKERKANNKIAELFSQLNENQQFHIEF